jgi:hypothetical protein
MNKLYLNILYGLLLGDSFIINNNNNKEIKLIIKIEGKHITYMIDIYKKISELGYCENKLPKIITKLEKKGKLNKLMLLHTYSTDNYLELYNKWYVDNFFKTIPKDLFYLFNEVSLAYWLMSEGKIRNRKLYVNMIQFSDKDIKFLIQFLENKFRFDKINLINNYLEFNCNNINKIYDITKPYIFPSMKFKFIT